MAIEVEVEREITVTSRITIDNVELIDMLRRLRMLPDGNVRVYFQVPGGGSYSNEEIEIDADNPIKLVVVSKHTEE